MKSLQVKCTNQWSSHTYCLKENPEISFFNHVQESVINLKKNKKISNYSYSSLFIVKLAILSSLLKLRHEYGVYLGLQQAFCVIHHIKEPKAE